MPAGSFPLPDMGRTGVMICGHGSRDDQACVEFARVVDAIAERLPCPQIMTPVRLMSGRG